MKKLLLLLLIITSFPIYSQEGSQCPVIEDINQEFCASEGNGNDYHLPMVSDLKGTDTGGGLLWYADQDSEEPLPSDHLLENGSSYFAGNASCSERTEVIVTIFDAPNAGATTFIIFCIQDEPVDVLTLMNPSILGAPDVDGYFEPAFNSGNTVFDPSTDTSGTYIYHVGSDNEICPDDIAVVYITVNPNPSAGEDRAINISSQAAVDLSDLLGEGVAADGIWSPVFSSGTNVFNPQEDSFGQYTYTVSSGNCEDTASINLVFNPTSDPEENCPVVAEAIQSFCESEGTGNNFYRPAIKHLAAESDDLAWYATAVSDEPLSWEEFLVDGVTYYAGDAANTCTNRVAVTVDLLTSPNAGATTFLAFCDSDEPVDVLNLMKPSILGAPDAGGYFVPQFASGTTMFDPSVDASGTYKYHVESPNNTCPDDEAVLYITVNPTPNAGADRTISLNSQSPADLGERLGEGVAIYGVWNPAFTSGTNIFDPQVDALGTYEYTVISGACEDTAVITIARNQQDPENCPIVAESVQSFCESEGTGNNFYRPAIKHLAAESDDLAWYATADSDEPLSWEEFLMDGVTYFAGDAANTCANRVAVTVDLLTSPNAGATTFLKFCDSDEPVNVLNLMKPSILGAPDAGGYFVPQFASGTTIFDPSVDASGTYKYHVESPNDTCPDDEAVVYITVNPTPNAGADRTINLSSQSPADLGELLGEGVAIDGAWNPAFASGTNIFDPQVDAPGAYEYTVTSGACEDTAVITIVQNPSDPNENCPSVSSTVQTFCESEGTGNNYYRPAVKHLAADSDDLAWYASATAEVPLSFEELLVNGRIYYAGDTANTCSSRIGVTVNLIDSPNAGKTTFITVDSTDEPFDIVEVMKPSILGAPDSGGSISPSLDSGSTIFDPSVDKGGQYIYSVKSLNGFCPDDSAVIYITVNPVTEEVAVYPNPSSDNINVKTTEPIISLRIIDLGGNIIRQEKSSLNGKNINISDLTPSMYLMEVTTSKGRTVRRFIKN